MWFGSKNSYLTILTQRTQNIREKFEKNINKQY